MSSPAISFNYSATIAASVTSGLKGQVLIPSTLPQDAGRFVVATTANRGSRRSTCIALENFGAMSTVRVQQVGEIPADVSGLATGTASWVRVSSTGYLERVTTPATGDDVVGRAEADGTVRLLFGVLTDTMANGGGSASVADDIAKSAGTTIDRVQGLRGRTLASTAPTTGEVYKYNGSQWTPGKPVPPGWYDPRDYGAAVDGTTDDLAAYQAMLAAMPSTGGVVHLPPGVSWLSDTLRVEKPIDLVGPSGGNRRFNVGFEAAPGKTAILLESAGISAGGGDAQNATVSGVDLKSRILIHGTAGGSSLGYGIDRVWNSGAISTNGCVIASAGAHPTKFFRCTDTGAGTTAKTLTSEPTWNATVGGTTSHQGAMFVCEKFPVVRADLTAYAIGDRVWAYHDNRFIFECTTAGTSAASAPADMVGGDSAPGVTIGGTVTDGTVVWTIRLVAGLVVAAGVCSVERVYARGFTGPGLAVVGGTGQFAAGLTDANCSKVRDVFVEYCGLGAYYAGDNNNGWLLDGLFAINCGTLQPTPNDAATAGYTDLGGHCLHDVSLASGVVAGFYAQLSTGRCILKNGLGRMTILSGYEELGSGGRAHCTGGTTTILGGNISTTAGSNSVIHLDFAYGKGVTQTVDLIDGVNDGIAAVSGSDGMYTMQVPTATDGVGYVAWKYGYNGPAGWWSLQHGNQQIRNAFLLAAAGAGLSPGPGWLDFQDGYLLGDPNTVTPYFVGHSDAETKSSLRNGLRKTGDRFYSSTLVKRLTSDGYRGVPWTAAQGVRASYADWGIPATHVEPTTNTGTNAGGEKVFRCTTAGTTGGTEPNWATAPVIGNTVTDGTAVWTYVGNTPSWTTDAAASGSTGTATADFGSFPGGTMASTTVTGQTGILTGSSIKAWIRAEATADHTADEHIALASLVDVVVSDVVAGTGFTIHVLCRDQGGEALVQAGASRNHRSNTAAAASNNNRPELFPSVGGRTLNMQWGQVSLAWEWI